MKESLLLVFANKQDLAGGEPAPQTHSIYASARYYYGDYHDMEMRHMLTCE
jgi:signal recognition particle receptor subunit beta